MRGRFGGRESGRDPSCEDGTRRRRRHPTRRTRWTGLLLMLTLMLQEFEKQPGRNQRRRSGTDKRGLGGWDRGLTLSSRATRCSGETTARRRRRRRSTKTTGRTRSTTTTNGGQEEEAAAASTGLRTTTRTTRTTTTLAATSRRSQGSRTCPSDATGMPVSLCGRLLHSRNV